MAAPDVVIVGGGVIGCSIAYALSRQRLRVTLLERGRLGCGASNAAAGVLAVGSNRSRRGALADLGRASAAMFPDLITSLRDATPIDSQYVRRGLLELALTPRDEISLRGLARRRQALGFQVEVLEPAALHTHAPSVAPAARMAALFHDDHTINNERFVQALAAAARHHGADIREDTPVTGMDVGRGRVLRVRAATEAFSPAVVVLTAGAWSSDVTALLRMRAPVRPARGEMLALRPLQPLPRHTIAWQDGYLVPRPDGELLVGSTTAYTDECVVTDSGVAQLLRRATVMIPALADATVVRRWAGLRPYSALGRPIIGPVPDFDNVILATGHYRNGILLAPITGTLVAELITERATSLSIQPFSYRAR